MTVTVTVLFALTACASSGAKRVDCEGRLQPINTPAAVTTPKVQQP